MRGSSMPCAVLAVLGLFTFTMQPVRAADIESAPAAPLDLETVGVSAASRETPPAGEQLSTLLPSERDSSISDAAETQGPLQTSDPLFEDDFDLDLSQSSVADPLEGFNRRVFAFNESLDRFAWEPMTRGYQFAVPEPARRGIHRVFQNLESPVIFTNQLLQLRVRDAGTTLGRFLLNTTAGAGGLFDPAAHGAGWERVESDFGQTLARYGMPSGAYLMVPLFGPSTVRDLVGDLVDRVLDPLTYMVGPIQWWIVLGTSQGLSEREARSGDLHALEAASIDFYSALRSAYHQSRQAEIRRARGIGADFALEPVSSSSF